MRATRAIATAALTAAALSGCSLGGIGGGSDDAASESSESPATTPATSAAPPSASSTPADPATESPTPSPPVASSPSAPTRPSGSAPASSPVPSSPPASQPTGGTVHTYQDLTLTLPVADDAIAGAPDGLTAYVRDLLTQQWDRYGHAKGCEKAPQLQVYASRSDGFAYVYRSANPAVESCPDAMADSGGYRAVLKVNGGSWQQVMSFQDVPTCSEFEKWSVPSAILKPDDKCTRGGAVVTYQHS